MNMFLHELRAYRKSTVIWTISLMVLTVLFLSFFSGITEDIEEFKKLLEGFPEKARLAMGLSLDNIGSFLGFYSYIFLYISLCGAIQAMNMGTSIISKEVREKTADFLLTKPVTRTQIMTSKLLAALTSLVITNIFFIATAVVMASTVQTQEYSTKTFMMISLTLFYLQLMFLALGIIASVILPKVKAVVPISLGTVFTLFFIGALAVTSGEDALRYFTPFKYFDLAYVMKNSSYETSFVVTAIVFIVAAIGASYVIYCKKDIHAV